MFKSSALAFGIALAATQSFADMSVKAVMVDQAGQSIREIDVLETPRGLLVQADLTGLNELGHGLYIHETGSCTNSFKAADRHYNPHQTGHGHTHEGGAHAGNLPNLYAGADGTVRVGVIVPDLTLTNGENAGAGGRIACGIIIAGK